MQKTRTPGSSGVARFALVVAWGLAGAISCGGGSHPIPKADGGAGSSGGDARNDAPAVTPDVRPGSDGTGQQLGTGRPCGSDSECATGFCTDGVCCESACKDTCWTCSAQGSVGACIPAEVGSDPRNDCADEGLPSCGHDGTCDGSGACRRYPPGTICRQSSCTGSTLTQASRCEGGLCKPTSGLPCDPYICDGSVGNACLVTCKTNADCGAGNVCAGGSCGRKAVGGTCTTGDDCNSNICQQGICCNEVCTGTCRSCAVPQSEGRCIPVPAGSDPLGQCADSGRAGCGTDGFCDGMGGCEIYSKATVCKDPACPVGGSVGTAAWKCDGAGTCASGGALTCNEYMCGATGACLVSCRDSTDCTVGNVCNGTICGKKVIGASCQVNNECGSGTCQQGVCCDMVCTGTCMACNQAASMGRCLPLRSAALAPAGQCPPADPTTCGLDGTCDGAGKCHLQSSGTICRAATCAAARLTLVGRCNGTGTCGVGAMQPCDPFQCATGTSCLTTCNSANGNADCTTGNTCISSSCGKKPLGVACSLGSECGSNVCAQGVCCDVPCAGTCTSCALSGSAGTCTNVPDGEDPLDQCLPDATSTCKHDGSCNGAGACRNYQIGTQCVAGSCSGSTLTPARTCDGLGTCQTGASGACPGFFVCDPAVVGGACKTTCSQTATPSDCVSPATCNGAACTLKGVGAACGGANECASGFCEQGVCCGSSCTGTCRSCALAATLGVCSNIPLGQPDIVAGRCPTTAVATCGTDGTCDGAGACHLYPAGAQCVGASCPAGTANLTPARACDGVGHCQAVNPARCDPFLCDGNLACKTSCTVATTTTDCLAPNSCNGTTCGKKPTGASCAVAGECNSGFCSQSTCCDKDCSGTCQSCALASKVGTCSLIPAGTAPAVASQCLNQGTQTCGTDGTCDGSGACRRFASGTVCVAGGCATGATSVQPRLCDGAGVCLTSATATCAGGFNCNTATNGCRTSCTIATQATDCASPNVCTGTLCGVLRLQYQCGDTNARSAGPHPRFQIINLGTAGVPLSELTIRYWFTGDGAQTFAGVIDFAANSANVPIQANMTSSFVAVTRTGADHYLQFAFQAAAGTLTAGGGTTVVQGRFNSTNPDFGVNFTQTGDYSFDPAKTAFTDWTHVTLYRNGTLVWGIEPS